MYGRKASLDGRAGARVSAHVTYLTSAHHLDSKRKVTSIGATGATVGATGATAGATGATKG